MSAKRLAVDVGVVTFNTRDLTVQALHRLLGVTTELDLRVMVFDNASADGTADAVAAEVDAEVIRSPRNLGFGAAMNRLLARGQSDWFCVLNSDAWPEPGALARLAEAGLTTPRAAIVTPRLLRPDGTLEVSTYELPSPRGAARAARGIGVDSAPTTAGPVGWAVGAVWLMRRAAYRELGGFDPRLFMYAEDLDWCWRATDAGWQVWHVPDAVFRHVGNASGEAAYGDRRTDAWVRSTYQVYRRHQGAASTLAYQAMCTTGALGAAVRRLPDRRASRFWWRTAMSHLCRGSGASA